ncbi:IclR family transcriptional regulator [Nocardiopsis sp. HUAS JQ3]|uniref:IclR family transcriptional regulator n=1 Tax=Nocardiopsis sp. HUAS JQ3 TaxID=3061629 RepID=UPI0023A94370|nr:IclR family transcriptional regulator [Nocardiopsis sp. HUAS JQ3]WDZ92771.1 IclR family transcriptional regulator [Nocardiopsis sp. HUAS JQ3]
MSMHTGQSATAPSTTRSGEVRSVARAGLLLNAVVDAPQGLSLTELAGATGLNISTVHRLLRTLCSEGLLCRDAVSERFLPGPVLMRLARRSLASAGLPEAADALRHLVDATGETSSLGVCRAEEVVVLLTTPSPDPFRYHGQPGLRRPLWSSAMGLAILAFGDSPLEEVAERWRARLPEREDAASALHSELLTTQFRGVAVVDDPARPGLRAVAAPVMTEGRVWTAVEVQGPAARLEGERLESASAALREAALRLRDQPFSLALVEG